MFPVEKLDDVEHIANKDSDKYGFKAIKSQQELFNPFVPRIVAVSSKLGLISFVTGKYVVGYEIGIFFTDLNKSFFKSEILNVQSLQFIESVDFPQLAISLPNKIQIHPLYTDSSSAGLIETIEIPENTKQIIFISHFLVYLESNQTLTFIDLKNKNSKSVFSIPDVLSIQKLQNSLTYFKNNKIYQINSDTLENIASGDSKMLIKYPFDIPNCFEYRFTYKENCVCFSNDPTDPKKLILTFIDSEKGVILYRSIPNFYIDDFNTNKVLITSSIHYPFVTLICEKRREIISLYTKDSSQFKILNPNDNKTFISPRSPKLDYKQIDATFMTSFDYLIPSVNNNYCLLIFYGDDFVFLYQYIDTENYFSNNEMSPIEATHFLYDEEKSSSEEDEEDYGNNEEEETKNGEEEETNNEEEEETKNEDEEETKNDEEEETKNDEEEETKNTSKEEEEEKKEIIANLESDSDNVNFIGINVKKAPNQNKSETQKRAEIQQFPPYDNQDKIKFKFNSTLKFKSKLQFKPYLFKVSSYFGLLITYNEENETLETYNLEHNLYYEEEDLLEPESENPETLPNSTLLIWTHSISKDSLKSITVVENQQYPLVVIGTDEGFIFLQIKNGAKYLDIKVNCGGVSQIQYKNSRPNEIVCLSSNSTLFSYNFVTDENDIICSKVSCFTIVKNGNIVFISGHNIFKCSKSSNVEQIQTIFEDNRFIVPVMNEYVFILSKEMIDSTEYPIFSLLNHETNTIVSCYKKDITDSFEPSNTCISSSEFHPLVVVGSEDTFGLYYFNATSIERFEQLVLDDANCILAQFNEETFEDEKYSGFEFFESSFYSFLLFPSLIHLFDDRIIRFYSIETINVDEFPYSLLTPTFQPISFDDIKEDIKEEKVGNINFNKPSISMLTRKSKLFSNCGTFIKNPVSLFSNQFTPTPRTTLKSNVYINPFKHPLDNPSYVKKQQSQKPSIFHSRFGK
ncbi:hypothetical protein TRFO_10629 [Tritrichomonas foetus]|uniref:Uncharacterized protein n=1 Tax=Tritrichomonas foetus TaxID=1144522 RepID=A0A1J4JA90_9EUKA|nr:hypothetical protein TRFO_10629 [Tritrichomonas foetus]|eukprot:OHS95151.1 hypothetical protein TRFO_10629 [Tritrichomonas foetus]